MKEAMKERSFSFLDRNYVEEFKDAHTFRQVLAKAIFLQRADVKTKYFEMDDGLLVGLYYKNPPGRLLRRQWTSDTKVMPCFSEWLHHLPDQSKLQEIDKFLDIKQNAVGLLKENSKFSFPSDNSIIRVSKHQAGGKRMGESQIIKDNFVFGLNEKKEVYKLKADGDDLLRKRDENKHADRRSDVWLCFDNGVRLTIEMQDSRKADMAQVPPALIPDWLKEKIEELESG